MPDFLSSPLGVCVLREPAPNGARTVQYPQYVHEIFAHAGLAYETVEPENLADLLGSDDLRLLVTVGEAGLPDDVEVRLRAWPTKRSVWRTWPSDLKTTAGACW